MHEKGSAMIKTVRRYTLVEILIVVGLMAVLMGIAMPAFTKMAKGSGITVAQRNLSAKINAARSYAITKRAYVALVFVTNDNTPAGIVPDNVRYSQYRPAIVTYDTASSSYVFSKWVDGEPWEPMPAGTVFGGDKDTATTPPKVKTALNASTTDTTVKSCDFQDASNSSTAKIADIANCLIFKPYGTTSRVGNEFTMWIWEGALKIQGPTEQPIITNDKNYVKISVNPFTGKLKFSQ